MNSVLKAILWIVGGLVLLVVVVIAAVAFLFDANAFRGRISAQVQESTGRTLTLGGVHLSVFPTLGASVTDATLGNAAGFGSEPFAHVGAADVGVKILPLLFHHRIDVGRVTLKDMQLNLVRHADGKSNWDDFSGNATATTGKAKPEVPSPQKRQAGAETIDISGIDIENASIKYSDEQAGKSYALSKFSVSTGSIGLGRSFDFKLSFSAISSEPQLVADVSVAAKLEADPDHKIYDMAGLEATVDASGKGVPGGKQQLKLTGGVHYDGGKGSLKLSDGKLSLANLVVTLALEGSGLGGKEQHIAGPLAVQPFSPRETLKALGMDLQTADSGALANMSLNGELEVGANSARLDKLSLKLDQSNVSGSLGLSDLSSQSVLFVLRLDQIDADRYLPPKAGGGSGGGAGKGGGSGDSAPLPTDAIDGFSASGSIDIGKLKFDNLNLSEVNLQVAALKHGAKHADLTAKAYSGTINSGTRMAGGGRPTYAETLKLSSVQVGPLLKDFMGKDKVTGQGNVSLDVTSAGRTVGEAKRALNGNVSFALQNGAVKGFDLAKILRQGQALLGGGQNAVGALTGGGESQQTDFSAFSGSGKFINGVLHSDQLDAQGPLFRVTGAGTVDLVNDRIDYLAKPALVNTASGQGGKDLSQLQAVVIPMHVTGPLSAPSYQLDVASALQQQAVQKLGQQLGKKLGGNGNAGGLINQLNGLFGGQQQQQQNPPPKP